MALPSLMTRLSLVSLVFHLVLPMTVSLTHQATEPVEHSGYGKETHQATAPVEHSGYGKGAHQATAPVEQSGYGKEIEFTVYLIDILYGPNATVVPVAGIQGQFWSQSTFGTILDANLILVAEPSLYARQVGRVRGLDTVVSRDGRYNFVTSSFVFTEHNGSTLETQGTFDRVSGQPSEIAVVGGTGQFRGARGINLLQLIEQTSYYVISRVTFRFSIPI